MPSSKPFHRFHRSKIAPLKERSHLVTASRLARRQDAGLSPPRSSEHDGKPPPELDDLSDEDVSEAESDDEEGRPNEINPFNPTSTSPSGNATVSQDISITTNPFIAKSTVTGSATGGQHSTPTHPATSTTTSSSTTLDGLPYLATNGASTTTNNPSSTFENSKSPSTITAIVIASVLGTVSVVAIAYLLLRYCTPLKARIVAYRGRRGERLAEEEDGIGSTRPALGMAQSNPTVAPGASPYAPNGPTTITTPAPAYTREATTNLARISTRGLPTVPIHGPLQDKDPSNPFTDQVPLSRSTSAGTMRSIGNGQLQNSFEDNILNNGPPAYSPGNNSNTRTSASDGYAASPMSISQRSHPGGLTNNPPTVIGRDKPGRRTMHIPRPTIPIPPRPTNPVPARLDAMTPTPSTPYFALPPPPDSDLESPRSQYQPRIRKSITPSDSVSNAPYSPLPFPIDLMPPVLPAPLMTSRWSQNSSSITGRTIEPRSFGGRMMEDGIRRSNPR